MAGPLHSGVGEAKRTEIGPDWSLVCYTEKEFGLDSVVKEKLLHF